MAIMLLHQADKIITCAVVCLFLSHQSLACSLPSFLCVVLAVTGLAGRTWRANLMSAPPLIHLVGACQVEQHSLSSKLSFFPQKPLHPSKFYWNILNLAREDLRKRSNNGGTRQK